MWKVLVVFKGKKVELKNKEWGYNEEVKVLVYRCVWWTFVLCVCLCIWYVYIFRMCVV